MERLALVLSGGGAKGAFEAGVLQALEGANLRPHVVSGTSAGAVNAAAVATGMPADRLAGWWTSISDGDVYAQRRDVWRLLRPAGLLAPGNLAERLLNAVGWTWLWDPAPLRRTLVRALGGEGIPVADGMVCAFSAVEIASGRLVRFANVAPPAHRDTGRFRVGDLHVDHLLASAAIPLLFRPATVAGVSFWDGAVVANTPIAPALAYEPDTLVVVMTAAPHTDRPEPVTLAEAVSRLYDVVQRFTLESDLARVREVNAQCEADPDRTDRRRVDLLVVEPGDADLGDPLHFDPATARQRVALGREIGARAIEGWRRPRERR